MKKNNKIAAALCVCLLLAGCKAADTAPAKTSDTASETSAQSAQTDAPAETTEAATTSEAETTTQSETSGTTAAEETTGSETGAPEETPDTTSASQEETSPETTILYTTSSCQETEIAIAVPQRVIHDDTTSAVPVPETTVLTEATVTAAETVTSAPTAAPETTTAPEAQEPSVNSTTSVSEPAANNAAKTTTTPKETTARTTTAPKETTAKTATTTKETTAKTETATKETETKPPETTTAPVSAASTTEAQTTTSSTATAASSAETTTTTASETSYEPEPEDEPSDDDYDEGKAEVYTAALDSLWDQAENLLEEAVSSADSSDFSDGATGFAEAGGIFASFESCFKGNDAPPSEYSAQHLRLVAAANELKAICDLAAQYLSGLSPSAASLEVYLDSDSPIHDALDLISEAAANAPDEDENYFDSVYEYEEAAEDLIGSLPDIELSPPDDADAVSELESAASEWSGVLSALNAMTPPAGFEGLHETLCARVAQAVDCVFDFTSKASDYGRLIGDRYERALESFEDIYNEITD